MNAITKGLERVVGALSAQKAKLALAATSALLAVSCGPGVAPLDGTINNPFNRPVPKQTVQGVVIAERSLAYIGQAPNYVFAVQEPDGRCYGLMTEGDTTLDSRINVGDKVTVNSQSLLSPLPYGYCVNFHYATNIAPSQVKVVEPSQVKVVEKGGVR